MAPNYSKSLRRLLLLAVAIASLIFLTFGTGRGGDASDQDLYRAPVPRMEVKFAALSVAPVRDLPLPPLTPTPTLAPTLAPTEAPTPAPTAPTTAAPLSNLVWEGPPLPPHLMPPVSYPSEAMTYFEQHLREGNFSLLHHGRRLYDLLVPHVLPERLGDVIEQFEAPRELLELPEGINEVEKKPASVDEYMPLQAAYDMLKRLSTAAPDHWANPPAGFVPSLGLTCMRADFVLLVQYIVRLEGVPLGRIVLNVNGRAAIVASMFVDILRRDIPGFVTGYPLRRNEGLAYAWNAIVRATFVLPVPPQLMPSVSDDERSLAVRAATDFVWISNVDLLHPPGAIVKSATEARGHIIARRAAIRDSIMTNKRDYQPGVPQPVRLMRGLGFAAFLYCATALPVYGYFDETLFPAYGEDIEFEARMHTLGDFPTAFSLEHTHLLSFAINGNKKLKKMVGRLARWHYITAKWNLTSTEWRSHAQYLFKHPFNDPRISLTAWYVDPKQRACVRYTTADSCQYDVADGVEHAASLRARA
ncbi:membrane-associated protein, putative [Bodo saltans]|uniref:Membrane-associated protein, putative n=1 Tax=Bodo saltans TaxID=75058 RepID=A0A0S4JSM2_BODSA|nr:membrane-associated protein, putative [Bodo saltans]|eukprot:CUG91542.1 membrane-associated protein, putative [Bodo saltans]